MIDDAALVRRFQDGDEEAFDELVERHRRRVYSLALRLVGVAEADDLAQDVFVAAYRSLPAFRGDATFSTWIYRITVYHCSHHRRRRRPELVELEAEHPDASREHNPVATTLRSELQAEVRRAIDTLPQKLREVIVLRDLHGLTYEEIAEVVDCPIGTVRSRLHYASQKLAENLRQYVEMKT